jgi:hypothetical protein
MERAAVRFIEKLRTHQKKEQLESRLKSTNKQPEEWQEEFANAKALWTPKSFRSMWFEDNFSYV